MKTFPAEFLNVDLDIKSSFDPAAIVKAWNNRVHPMHTDKHGRQYWLRLSLALQPKAQPTRLRVLRSWSAIFRRESEASGRRRPARNLTSEVQAGFSEVRANGCWNRTCAGRLLTWARKYDLRCIRHC